MLKRLVDKYNSLSADGVVGVWLAVWWLANLFTAGCSELANDEAYYHIFAQNLAWGYYDHPPMTALLVWLGESLFAGELGVRFFFVLLQPLYLYIFWRVISPKGATRSDAELFVMMCSATLWLDCCARWPAVVLYGYVPLDIQALYRIKALGLADNGTIVGLAGIEQISRCFGAVVCVGGKRRMVYA